MQDAGVPGGTSGAATDGGTEPGSFPVTVARVYDDPAAAGRGSPSVRVLVDRLWPRGLTRERADLDLWLREIAPSNQLRTWYGHEATLYPQFHARYLDELTTPERAQAMSTLRECIARTPVVLLTATKEVDISHAAVLLEVLTARSA